MTLLSDTAYHSFMGEVEALNTTTIRRLIPSARHQLPAITLVFVNKFTGKHAHWEEKQCVSRTTANSLSFRLETGGPISSLHEAWFHTPNKCVSDVSMNERILPLMRNCFFAGALHPILLLQKGHADQLASDIAEFIREEPQS
jgi:hypothetical protein